MSLGEMSWSRTAADSRIARGFCYLQIAFFGGMALIVGTAGVLLVVSILRNGAYEVALLVFLLALVGGPFSLVYLWPMLTDSDQRPPHPVFWDEYRRLPRRWIAVSSVLGGGITGAVALWPRGAGFPLLGFLFVAYVCGGLFIGEGRFDPDAKTVVRNGQKIDLEAVSADRRYDVAGHSVLLLLFDRWATKTRLVLVPRRIADEIAATLGPDEDRGPETTNHGDDESKSRPRAVMLTLTAFGLGALALSVGLVALARNVADPGVLYWAALVGGFLGGLFIWLARRG
jgi:hypothetical protein